MRRSLTILAATLSGVASSGCTTTAPARAAWVNVLPTVVYPGIDRSAVMVSGGAQVPVNAEKTWSIAVDAAGFSGYPYYMCATGGGGAYLGLGALWRPWKLRRFGGFFLQPKLVTRLASVTGALDSERVNDNCPRGPFENGLEGDIGVGLTIGYEVVLLQHLYLASAIGSSVGLCVNCLRDSHPLAGFSASTGRQPTRAAYHLDLALLRLGVAF